MKNPGFLVLAIVCWVLAVVAILVAIFAISSPAGGSAAWWGRGALLLAGVALVAGGFISGSRINA